MSKTKMRLIALAMAGAVGVGYVSYAYATGLWPNFPVVGGATYCAGSTSSATGTIIGLVTGCPNQVPAGPLVVTGNEQIPADTRLTSGANPQTVLLGLASLNSLPLTFTVVTGVNPTTFTAANNSGGIVFDGQGVITAAVVGLPQNPIQGQQYRISSNRGITTLTVNAWAQQQTLFNAPGALTITPGNNGPIGYTFVWNTSTLAWYRLE